MLNGLLLLAFWCSLFRFLTHMLGVKGYTLNTHYCRRGIMARFLVQLVMVGIQTVSRAFTQTLRQEYQATMAARRAAEEAGRDGSKAAQAASFTGISLQEAQQILNIKDIDDIDIIRKNYEHLFKVNDKASGGSFYLQSKVVRAKERIEMELDEKVCPDPTPNDETSSHSTQNSDSKS